MYNDRSIPGLLERDRRGQLGRVYKRGLADGDQDECSVWPRRLIPADKLLPPGLVGSPLTGLVDLAVDIVRQLREKKKRKKESNIDAILYGGSALGAYRHYPVPREKDIHKCDVWVANGWHPGLPAPNCG